MLVRGNGRKIEKEMGVGGFGGIVIGVISYCCLHAAWFNELAHSLALLPSFPSSLPSAFSVLQMGTTDYSVLQSQPITGTKWNNINQIFSIVANAEVSDCRVAQN